MMGNAKDVAAVLVNYRRTFSKASDGENNRRCNEVSQLPDETPDTQNYSQIGPSIFWFTVISHKFNCSLVRAPFTRDWSSSYRDC